MIMGNYLCVRGPDTDAMATDEKAALRLAHPTVVPETPGEDDDAEAPTSDGLHPTVRPDEDG